MNDLTKDIVLPGALTIEHLEGLLVELVKPVRSVYEARYTCCIMERLYGVDIRSDWVVLLRSIGISTSGTGFGYGTTPEWLDVLYNPAWCTDRPILTYHDNQRRTILVRALIKGQYNG